MAHIPGKFVWFEHVSGDDAKARAFYEDLLGWRNEAMPMGDKPYTMIMNGGEAIGGYGDSSGGPARWISYVSVADVDKTYAAALAAGATSESEPVDFGTVGRGAAIVDPTGARVSLWKSAQDDQPDRDDTPVGGWVWNELETGDTQAALAFYTQVVGYTQETMDMGPAGMYHVLKTGERGRAGVMQLQDPKQPTQWVPYVHVDDVDATVAKAGQLGATACMPVMDVPEVGRIGMVIDPQGASIAFIKPAPRQA